MNKGASRESYLCVRPKPPFRLDFTVWTLRRRPDNILDRWDNRTYRRVIVLEEEPAEISVSQTGSAENPLLNVTIAGIAAPPINRVRAFLETMLGINVDLSDFYRFAKRNPQLEQLMERFCGLKPPRFPSIFEALVNGITCQQLTLTLGVHLLNKLTLNYGAKLDLPGGSAYAFPRPTDLVNLKVENFRQIGYSLHKAEALIELSAKIISGELDLANIEGMDYESALEQLDRLRGVGRWTGEYVLLRGLGRLRVFPVDDLGGRNSLQRWLKTPQKLDAEEAKRLLSAWDPYGGLLYFHLLLEGLKQKGIIE